MRSHDQFNTTIYSLNDRYRGIKKGRKVIFVHPDDLAALGIENGDLVDVHSEFTDNVDRVVHKFKAVAFPTSAGCAAAYFPEANPLVPLDFTAEGSNTPASKSVVVRLEPVGVRPPRTVAARRKEHWRGSSDGGSGRATVLEPGRPWCCTRHECPRGGLVRTPIEG